MSKRWTLASWEMKSALDAMLFTGPGKHPRPVAACSKGNWNCDCNMMCNYPDKWVDGGCCGLKVCLAPFPAPPPVLQSLWSADTPGAKLFRENARSFNNALALSSIKVRERRFQQGYCPSVIYEGKVFQYSGPLQAEVGERHDRDPFLDS